MENQYQLQFLQNQDMSKCVKKYFLAQENLPLIHQNIGCIMAKFVNCFEGKKVILCVKKNSCYLVYYLIVLPVKVSKISNQKFLNISQKIGIWHSRWTSQELFSIKSKRDTEVCFFFSEIQCPM